VIHALLSDKFFRAVQIKNSIRHFKVLSVKRHRGKKYTLINTHKPAVMRPEKELDVSVVLNTKRVPPISPRAAGVQLSYYTF
jgi:hypothetical protein